MLRASVCKRIHLYLCIYVYDDVRASFVMYFVLSNVLNECYTTRKHCEIDDFTLDNACKRFDYYVVNTRSRTLLSACVSTTLFKQPPIEYAHGHGGQIADEVTVESIRANSISCPGA